MKNLLINKLAKAFKNTTQLLLVIGMITVGFVSCSEMAKTSEKDLMGEFFKKDTKQVDDIIKGLVSFGMADPDKNKKDSLRMGLEQYKLGDFEKTQSIFNEYLGRYGEDSTARYYLGLALMNMGDVVNAIKQFTIIQKDNNFEQMHWLKYNKALCYLRQNDAKGKMNAKKELDSIINDENFSDTDRQAIKTMVAFAN